MILAGTELIFFVKAHMKLWFGFLMKTVVIVFSCCREALAQSPGLFRSLCYPISEEARGAQETGEVTAGTVEPDWPKGYPILYGIMLRNKS